MELCLVHVQLADNVTPEIERLITTEMYVMSFGKTHRPYTTFEWLPDWIYEGNTTYDAVRTAIRVRDTLFAATQHEMTVWTIRGSEVGVSFTSGIAVRNG